MKEVLTFDRVNELSRLKNKRSFHNRPFISYNPVTGNYKQFLGHDIIENMIISKYNEDGYLNILDIGTGSGFGMVELRKYLDKLEETEKVSGISSNSRITGIGLNRYDEMYLPVSHNDTTKKVNPDNNRFVIKNLFDYNPNEKHNVIMSVFATQYMPNSLLALERINNELITDKGKARIHVGLKDSTLLSVDGLPIGGFAMKKLCQKSGVFLDDLTEIHKVQISKQPHLNFGLNYQNSSPVKGQYFQSNYSSK